MAPDSLRHRLGSAVERSLPVVDWLPAYSGALLRADVVAGITVSASVIPEGLAYATLAGLPPVTGIYAGLLAAVVYLVFGTSRQVIVGPTSALAILLASGVGSLAAGDAAAYAGLVAFTTVLVGLVGVAAWALRLGFLVNFVSGSVLTGFSAGAALYIASTQLGPLMGIEGASGVFYQRLVYLGRHLGEVHLPTLAVGVTAIALLALGARRFPRAPAALVVVVLSIVASTAADLQARGVAVVGPIPSGLPSPSVPPVPDVATLEALLPVAGALFLLSYVQGIGAVETFARKHDYEADPDQELLAAGAANVAAGVGGGFAVGGSMSRSALNDGVGGRTQLVNLVVAVVLVIVLVFLTGVFTQLPRAVLSAVVIVAVSGLVDLAGLRRLSAVSRSEFVVAVVVLVGVLAFGMLAGVAVGVLLSLLITVGRITYPQTVELGRIEGTDHVAPLDRGGDVTAPDRTLVYRVAAELFYANAPVVRKDLLRRVDDRSPAPELVVFDLSSSPTVDLAAAETLSVLADLLAERGVDLRLAEATADVEALLRRAGLEESVGPIEEAEPVVTVIDRWRAERSRRDGTGRR